MNPLAEVKALGKDISSDVYAVCKAEFVRKYEFRATHTVGAEHVAIVVLIVVAHREIQNRVLILAMLARNKRAKNI